MSSAYQELNRFRTEEDGNITIFSVMMIVLILIITGASVDIMRFEATRAQLQATMDRAVLAAADLDQHQHASTVVTDYMQKAGLEDALGGVDVEDGFNYRVVDAHAQVELDTFFLHMSGFDRLTAPARSIAEEKISNVEVSLVLDISGSMRNNGRMDRMRPAAQSFVNKVMTEQTNGITTLNLVPFAGQVNPGDILFDYFRGERPKIKKNENNGWGNGDQDAPGGSLCNNNAENADEGASDPSCSDGTTTTETTEPAAEDYFQPWAQAISNIVIYFDTDGDEIYDVAHKIQGFPENAPRDTDDFFKGAVAYMMSQDGRLQHADQFLGISIKGGKQKTRYFQVNGDENGPESDIGPKKNRGKIPGNTYSYGHINFDYWAQFYTSPNPETPPSDGTDTTEEPAPGNSQNVNMPSSCVEIYNNEFATTEMPKSDDYVPHFNFWPYDETVMDWGWCPGEDTTVQYYSANRQQLVDFIGDMRMHDGTGLQYGMKYGLALLDPANRDEVGHLIDNGVVDPQFRGRPIDWHDPETEKYVVLMTDGQTTDQYRPQDPEAPINNDEALQTQGSGSYYTMSSRSTNISNLLQQCDLARLNGVTVFTIAFETSNSAANDMKACASSPSHHFHVHGDEIADAFDAVARQINNLRLIQ
ncbi:TadE/TadG family type IV pilus assembly protein [Pseudoponticoccus marisrubri]|uniref:Putative Flp pilus-assembly TadG-like N-terminal domain-containing protein n=1 Tax=Pseudoponticoccus marisrubri TaxID=1685382 RepID=A0A0W7WFB8_9RHOB|nr:TadE/TadG family type IV pilus assembly protein [Pseudoponticoccus marisrubri]KUF09253.1 hypothetical protein AVJ23_18540 [Pseudoponticoccus marisrubri]